MDVKEQSVIMQSRPRICGEQYRGDTGGEKNESNINNFIIEITKIKKHFLSKTISYPDIVARNGDFVLITGASGSGKTTLCEMIAKFLPYDSGNIAINGEDIKKINVFEHIHYISQFPEHNLIGPTSFEDLKMWLEYSITMEKENLLIEKLKEYYLGDLIEKPIWKLSFGKKKALAFCVLSIIQRNIWVLDEPFAGMDNELSKKINELFVDFLTKGGIIIGTSHVNNLNYKVQNIELKGTE
ncbi:MAG: ATP-binding cassette domain-containing protein [Candidatus Cloacimonetes bacterium]|nr:ATP-binding cassette domain-containing protein [Candidatus Cloacimonadota bacterium]